MVVVTDTDNTLAVAGIAVILFAGVTLAVRLATGKTEAERIAAIQATRENRVAMEQMEARYQVLSDQQKQVIDVALTVLDAVKGLVPGKIDDALVDLGRDIQGPGPQ